MSEKVVRAMRADEFQEVRNIIRHRGRVGSLVERQALQNTVRWLGFRTNSIRYHYGLLYTY
jgi:hypothetical protein